MSEKNLKARYEEDSEIREVFELLASLETMEAVQGKLEMENGEALTAQEEQELRRKMQKFVLFCEDFAQAKHADREEVENIPVVGRYGSGVADRLAMFPGLSGLQSTVGGIIDSHGEGIAVELQNAGMDVRIPELAGVDPAVRGFEDAVANILYENGIKEGHDFDDLLPESVREKIHEARRKVTSGRDTGGEDFKSPAEMKDARFSDMTLWNRLGQYVMDKEEDRQHYRDQYVTFGKKGFKVGAAYFDSFSANRKAARRNLMCKGAAIQVVESMYPSATDEQKSSMALRISGVLQKGAPLFRDFIYCVDDPSREAAQDPKMHAIHEHPVVKQMAVLAGEPLGLTAPAADVERELKGFGLDPTDVELTAESVTNAMQKSSTKWGRDRIVEAVGMAVCMKQVNAAADSLEKDLNDGRTFQEGRQVTNQFRLAPLERRKLAEALVDQMHKAVKRDGKDGDEPSITPQDLLKKLNVSLGDGKNGASYLTGVVIDHLMGVTSHVRQYARVGLADDKFSHRSYQPFADSMIYDIAKGAFKDFVSDVQVERGMLVGEKSAHVVNCVAERADLPGTPKAKSAMRGFALAEATRIVDASIVNIQKGENHPLRKDGGPAVPAPSFDLQSTVRRHLIEQFANHLLDVHSAVETRADLEAAVSASGYAEKLEANLVRETYASRNNDVNKKLKFAHYGNYREGQIEKIYPTYIFSGRVELGTLQSGSLDKVVDCVKRRYDSKSVERPYYGHASASTVVDEAISLAGASMPNVDPGVRKELAEAIAAHLDTIGKDGRKLSVDDVVKALNTAGREGKSAMQRLAEMPQRIDKAAITRSSLKGHEVDGKTGHVWNRRGHIYDEICADLADQGLTSIDIKIVRAQVSEGVDKELQTMILDQASRAGAVKGMSRGLRKLVDAAVKEHFELDDRRIQKDDVARVVAAVSSVLLNGVGDQDPDFAKSHGFMGMRNPGLASRRTYGDDPQALKDALKAKISEAMDKPVAALEAKQLLHVPDTKETLAEKAKEAKLAKEAAKAAEEARSAAARDAEVEVQSGRGSLSEELFSNSEAQRAAAQGVEQEVAAAATRHPSPLHAEAAAAAAGLRGTVRQGAAQSPAPTSGRPSEPGIGRS